MALNRDTGRCIQVWLRQLWWSMTSTHLPKRWWETCIVWHCLNVLTLNHVNTFGDRVCHCFWHIMAACCWRKNLWDLGIWCRPGQSKHAVCEWENLSTETFALHFHKKIYIGFCPGHCLELVSVPSHPRSILFLIQTKTHLIPQGDQLFCSAMLLSYITKYYQTYSLWKSQMWAAIDNIPHTCVRIDRFKHMHLLSWGLRFEIWKPLMQHDMHVCMCEYESTNL